MAAWRTWLPCECTHTHTHTHTPTPTPAHTRTLTHTRARVPVCQFSLSRGAAMSERQPLLPGASRPSHAPDDAPLLRELAAAATHMEELVRIVGVIERDLLAKLGTKDDSRRVREKLRTQRERAAPLLASTSAILTRVASAPMSPTVRTKHSRLMTQYGELARECRKLTQLSEQRERSFSSSNLPPSHDSEDVSSSYGDQILALTPVDDVDSRVVAETNAEWQELGKEISVIRELFGDVSGLVDKQGEQLTTVDGNTESAAAYIEEGEVELEKALTYQRSARRKMCLFGGLGILIVTIAIVLLVLYLNHTL
mmetsp:Transcript_53299/g.133801  ORF Transcript_53299/g.133801 Transcript_53299/m.133801 type:complete len:311 (+) Transcript_53299:1-933(+)